MKVNKLINKLKNKLDLKYVIIILGIICIAFLVFLQFEMQNFGQYLDKLDKNLANFVAVQPKVETDFTLSIDRLNLADIPIATNIDGSEKDIYMQALENAIAHMQGTVLPGQQGNSFIFGHSSYYTDKPGNYKEVFEHLDQLQKNDLIVIKSSEKDYSYQVISKKIVDPDDISVLDESNNFKLTLMTCWPPGTIKKRYVVIAELVQ